MRKWYVFDMYDCLDDFETARAAAAFAEQFLTEDEEVNGMHIAYMTQAEMLNYCASGKFPFSQ